MTRLVLRGYRPQAQRELRELKGWSAEKLGKRAGISTSTVQRNEAGRSSPSIDNLRKVAVVLECALSDLIEIPLDQRLMEDWRNLSGLLQAEVAAKLKISTTSYGNMERGATPLARIDELCELFQATPHQLREAWERSHES